MSLALLFCCSSSSSSSSGKVVCLIGCAPGLVKVVASIAVGERGGVCLCVKRGMDGEKKVVVLSIIRGIQIVTILEYKPDTKFAKPLSSMALECAIAYTHPAENLYRSIIPPD